MPDKTDVPVQRRSGAESSRKVLHLLLAFNERRHTRTAAELAAELGTPLSSVYRYLSVLREEGMVEEARPGEYRLSLLFVGLAGAARAAGDSLEKVARPVLSSVAEKGGETTLLIKRVGWNATCVDRAESPHPVRLQFEPGQPMILHKGSASRVLLASMPPDDRRRYLATVKDLTAPQREQIEADVDTVARVGWVESFGEVDEGIWGASAVIRDCGDVVAALGVAGPLYRLQHADRARIIDLVVGGAAEISRVLEGRS
ncbi:IclR family transcriptional regulator [Actinocorallia sp. A-T 12471]|uniref:IclR family transcriptional regulator n=1 Tax=Actinocorallia sp. A-T 12471 TaxID=3089813 RepID=UPI0029D3F814|nr:IclR family transcriptional regulator [Actinocorallia sp. A-T 12471]MDX6744069.1 IclR family transcriptional regulator [Actinocorallia sp. A-T 12471]